MKRLLVALLLFLFLFCGQSYCQAQQRPTRVSIILIDADVPIVLEMLFKATNNRVIIDEAISGTVTKLELLDVSWDLVLKTICETCNLVTSVDKNNVYWVKNKPGAKRINEKVPKTPN